MMALSLEIPIGFKMAKQVMAQLEVLIFLQNQIALQVGSSSSRGLGNRSKDTLMAAWNVTICSSASSLLKLTSKSRAEQVLGMLSSPEVSLSTITRGRTDQKYVPNEDRLHMGPSPKRGYYAAFTDMADEDTVVEEEIAGGVVLKKRRLTMEQVRFLESSFESENKLEPERKAQIAQRLGLQPRQVAVWFQNRRARSKSKQLERDFLALKADYEAVLVENQKLQAEVLLNTPILDF